MSAMARDVQDMDLSNLGNVDSYKNEQISISSRDLIKTSGLALKLYAVLRRDQETNETGQKIENSRKLLTERITAGEIDPQIGLGFAIFSQDSDKGYLNVGRWGKNHPIILYNDVFTMDFDGQRPTNVEMLDLNEEGPYCIHEGEVVNFEMHCWRGFLASPGNNNDKKDYLNSTFSTGFH